LLRQVLTNPKTYSNLMTAGSRDVLGGCPEADRIIKEEGFGRFMPTIVNNYQIGARPRHDPVSHELRFARPNIAEARLRLNA
jgi:hypothetical protein